MKSIKLKYIVLLVLVIGLVSCNDLDRFPYDSISLEQSFEKVSDMAKWDEGIYATLRGNVYGIYTYSTDVQADELNASLDYGNRNGFLHRWNGFLADDYTIRDVWAGYYGAITNLNEILEGSGNIKPKDANETKELNEYNGDAHLARAYYYYKLMLRYAKPYNASTASTDLGVPLVVKYDINQMPARATEKEVYTQILDDIDKAKTLLAGVSGEQGAIRFNEDIVLALEARVSLYMQNWAAAEAAANTLIHSGTYPLITDEATLRKMWVNDDPQEVIFQCFVSKPDELANTNSIYLGYNSSGDYYTPDFIPSQWVVDAYGNNDIRKKVYFDSSFTVHIQGSDYHGIWLVNKYPGNPDLWTSASTNYEQAPKIFRIAEMYLISAEAAYNQKKYTDAANVLNELRVARGLNTLPTNITGDPLMDSIKMGRFRELAFEGFRLNDLERWHEGFQRHDPQNIDVLMTGSDFDTKKVAADADKFVWGIPSHEVTINPNLKGEQNPGW